MDVEDIEKIGVVGAGDMGHGIAEVAILAGYDVVMRDVKQEFVDNGMEGIKGSIDKLVEKDKISEDDAEAALDSLKGTTEMDDLSDVDFVVEAVPEKMDLKKDVFGDLDDVTPDHAILGTNTSNMSITEIAKATDRPEKVVGMHFFNPPVLMDLVEVVRGGKTSDETMQVTYDLSEAMGKYPVKVEKDSPGFIVNRVNAPIMVLIGKILDTEKAEPREVDAVAKDAGMTMGPFELADYVGIDIMYHSASYLAEEIDPEYGPSEKIEKMVEEENLGKKTGQGFYDWSEGRPEIDESDAPEDLEFGLEHLAALQVNEATKLLEEGVTDDPEEINEAVKKGGNVPTGPFETADLFGYDSLAETCEELAEEYDLDIFKPTKTLREGNIEI